MKFILYLPHNSTGEVCVWVRQLVPMKQLKSYFDVLPPGALGSNLIICRQNPPTPEAQGLLVKHSKMVAA